MFKKYMYITSVAYLLTTFILCSCDDEKPRMEVAQLGGEMVGGETTTAVQGLLRLDQPTSGQVLDSREVNVQGIHSTASEVFVNDESVPVESQRFSTMITLDEGPQIIEVRSGEDVINVNILVDETPPKIQITEPNYGAHIDSNQVATVTLIGSVLDGDLGSGVESIMINGQEVFTEANGRFQFTYTPELGLNRPVVIARDRAGHEQVATKGFLYGRFKQWGSQLDRSVRGEIKPEALDVIGVTLENALKSGLVNDLIEDNMGFSDEITVEEVLFQDIDVQLEPANGYINVVIRFYDLRIFFELSSPSTRGDVYVSPATLTAELYLSPNSDGTLNAQILNPNVTLQNLNIQVDNVLLDTAVSFIEGFVSSLAEDTLLAALEQALLNQLISPTLFSPLLEIIGVEVRVSTIFQSIFISPESIQVELGIKITDLPAINNTVGYLFLPSEGAPERLTNMASTDIHQNALFMVFSHLWHGGFLNVTLAELIDPPSTLSAALLNGFTDGKLVEYMPGTELIGVRLRPMLPPITRFDLTRPNALIIDLVDLHIDLTLPDGQTWFTLGIDLSAAVVPKLINNRLDLDVDLAVNGTAVDEPIFPVRSKELISLIVNLIKNLPNQLGNDGLRNLFDLSEIDFYGLRLNSGTLQGVEFPAPYLQVGIDLNAIIQ